MGRSICGPVDTTFTSVAASFAVVLILLGLGWGSWSQSDILLNKAFDPDDLPYLGAQYPANCEGCRQINKLTMRRSPNKWCTTLRQQVYLPDAPPPPPPTWRRLEEEGELTEGRREETSVNMFGKTFKYVTWENTSCVTDEWYFQSCANRSAMVYPEMLDDCDAFKDSLKNVTDNVVPRECTSDIYKDKAGWGDCLPMVTNDAGHLVWCHKHDDLSDTPTPPTSTFYHPNCTCTCGNRCKAKLDECSDYWTGPERYKLSDCRKGKAICHGTATIYGVAVCGAFFAVFALLVWSATLFVKTRRTAKLLNALAMCVQALSAILIIAALGAWMSYTLTLNEPRKIFLECLGRFEMLEALPLEMFNPPAPRFFTQYIRANPWSFRIDSGTKAYVQVDSQIEWNWSPDYLSVGWWTTVSALLFQILSLVFAKLVSFSGTHSQYEATKSSTPQDA